MRFYLKFNISVFAETSILRLCLLHGKRRRLHGISLDIPPTHLCCIHRDKDYDKSFKKQKTLSRVYFPINFRISYYVNLSIAVHLYENSFQFLCFLHIKDVLIIVSRTIVANTIKLFLPRYNTSIYGAPMGYKVDKRI